MHYDLKTNMKKKEEKTGQSGVQQQFLCYIYYFRTNNFSLVICPHTKLFFENIIEKQESWKHPAMTKPQNP